MHGSLRRPRLHSQHLRPDALDDDHERDHVQPDVGGVVLRRRQHQQLEEPRGFFLHQLLLNTVGYAYYARQFIVEIRQQRESAASHSTAQSTPQFILMFTVSGWILHFFRMGLLTMVLCIRLPIRFLLPRYFLTTPMQSKARSFFSLSFFYLRQVLMESFLEFLISPISLRSTHLLFISCFFWFQSSRLRTVVRGEGYTLRRPRVGI